MEVPDIIVSVPSIRFPGDVHITPRTRTPRGPFRLGFRLRRGDRDERVRRVRIRGVGSMGGLPRLI
jgi:hypothetical protein